MISYFMKRAERIFKVYFVIYSFYMDINIYDIFKITYIKLEKEVR